MKLIDLFRRGRNSCDGGLILKAGKGFSPDASRLNWIDMSQALFLHRARRASAACDSGNLRRVPTNKAQNPRGEEFCFRPSERGR